MSFYQGTILSVKRKLDGNGRLQIPGDFREAVGFAPNESVTVSAVKLMEDGTVALLIKKAVG